MRVFLDASSWKAALGTMRGARDEQIAMNAALERLISRRLPLFAVAWLLVTAIWVIVLVLEADLSWSGALAAFLVEAVLVGGLIAVRIRPRAIPFTGFVVAGCVVLGVSNSAVFYVVGGHGDFLAFVLLTLYLMVSLFFGWGWRRTLIVLCGTVVAWGIVLPHLTVTVPTVELGGAILAGSVLALGVAEGFARDFRATFREQQEREAARAREQAALAAAERARVVAEDATRAKDRLLAIVSHDLRSPIATALSWMNMLRRDPAQGARALDTIERSLRMSLRLLGDLLDVARIATGKVHIESAEMDLGALVGAVVEGMRVVANDKGLVIDARVPGVVPVHADQDRLRQVIENLVSNAVKFTPRGGRVDVEVWTEDAAAELVVRDTGVGIAPDVLPHVFEPFRQADGNAENTGLGLGLAIAKYLVEAHGGTIAVESPGRNQGATFRVSLPMAAPPG